MVDIENLALPRSRKNGKEQFFLGFFKRGERFKRCARRWVMRPFERDRHQRQREYARSRARESPRHRGGREEQDEAGAGAAPLAQPGEREDLLQG